MIDKIIRFEPAIKAVLIRGRWVLALAILGLGIERLACVGPLTGTLIETGRFGTLFGLALGACGVGLLFKRTLRTAAMTLGGLLFLYTLIFEVPRYVAAPGNMSFRTVVFEPLAIAALAWLLPGLNSVWSWLARTSRYILALSLIVFGVDHFIGLSFIATLVSPWIPWHRFWVAFFSAGLVGAGLSIGLNRLLRSGAACIGLMFAIWVFTLHLPRVFGFSNGAGPHSPAEWSSLFIAVALWGGFWALAGLDDLPAARPDHTVLDPESHISA
jgi:hypothetical protein